MKRLLMLIGLFALLLMGCDESTKVEDYFADITINNISGTTIEGFVDDQAFTLQVNGNQTFTIELEDEDEIETITVQFRQQASIDYVTFSINVANGDQETINVEMEEGELLLQNYSQDDVWYEINYGNTEWLDSNYQVSYIWDLYSSNYGNESTDVVVTYGGDYWWWYDYEETVTVTAGETTVIEIIGDAGEIIIENNSTGFWIEEVYLSPSSDPTWGENDLNGDIGPGEFVTWKVTTGDWDILVVDNWDDEFESLNNNVGPEETLTFTYTDLKRSNSIATDKRTNASKYTELTEDLCEQREK